MQLVLVQRIKTIFIRNLKRKAKVQNLNKGSKSIINLNKSLCKTLLYSCFFLVTWFKLLCDKIRLCSFAIFSAFRRSNGTITGFGRPQFGICVYKKSYAATANIKFCTVHHSRGHLDLLLSVCVSVCVFVYVSCSFCLCAL